MVCVRRLTAGIPVSANSPSSLDQGVGLARLGGHKGIDNFREGSMHQNTPKVSLGYTLPSLKCDVPGASKHLSFTNLF